MKIIGHRGAAGLALENTLPSLELARLLGVDGIEFDVRKTKDGQLVVCHDNDLSRLSNNNQKLSDLDLTDLQKIKLNDKQSHVPSLRQALQMTNTTPVIIELKEHGCIDALLEILDEFPSLPVIVASFKHDELVQLHQKRPEVKIFGLERTKPLEIIQAARILKFDGVGLNFWLLNPLTYFLLKRYNLETYVYTVNSRLLGNFIKFLYPDVAICTDHPEWFISHPWLKLRSQGRFTTSRARAHKRKLSAR